jgi:hypothetical protein
MMVEIDMERSRGEMMESLPEELRKVRRPVPRALKRDVPHTDKVLHHEFVESFRRVGHVDLASAVPKVRLLLLKKNSTANRRVAWRTFSVM